MRSAVAPDDLDLNALADELAGLFGDDMEIGALLAKAGIPPGDVPQLGTATPKNYWRILLQEIGKGAVANGIENILAAAADTYPGNRKLQRFLRRDPTMQESRPDVHPVMLRLNGDARTVVALIAELHRQGIPVEIAFGQADPGDET